MTSSPSSSSELTILDLPDVVLDLFRRAERPLLPGATGEPGLFIRYLRRKSGRGLAVIYSLSERGAALAARKAQASDPNRAVSLTLDEKALEGAHIRFGKAEVAQAALKIESTGVLEAADLGLSVQAFPADSGLPTLAASCNTRSGTALFAALSAAAHTQLGDSAWNLLAARAIPVRYKPASRCVIRYELELERASRRGKEQRKLTIFGKVYAEPEQAKAIQTEMQRLYKEQTRQGQPFLPRPLGLLDALGLTLNEAIEAPDFDGLREPTYTGTRLLHPVIIRGRGGEFQDAIVFDSTFTDTAAILARLHTSTVRPAGAPRSGAKEAKRARERAGLIAARNSAQADEVQRLAGQLAERLETLVPTEYRPAHGGFKASQLLYHSHQAFVVDFDGFCLADPALDVGYFLAYLRPGGLWYQKPGTRQWFEKAASIFLQGYRDAMLAREVSPEEVEGLLERVPYYEAALLFKIATRRVNRLNSPRPQELAAMLQEIAACLSTETRRD